ncbi:MAG: FHA domain-containing protein [Actinomycetota bacterium]
MSSATHRVAALPGEGAVARTPDLLAVAADADALPEGPALRSTDRPVAAIWWAVDGQTSYATRAGATVTVDGTVLPDAADPTPMAIAETSTVRLALPGASPDAPPDWGDLRDGVVAGSAAVLVPLVEPRPEAEPHAAVEFDWVDLRAGADGVEPRQALAVGESQATSVEEAHVAELVQGIMCSRNHFNNPQAAYCQVCGISMVHLTHGPVTGPRPTLGFLVFDDGATYALDRDYVAGRAPDISGEPNASPLTILDEELSVSGTHARIDLSGWDVVLHDLGSTNGTFIWNAAQQQWVHVPPHTPTILSPGSTAAFGRQTFVFESAVRQR